jgi:hypothetical protein
MASAHLALALAGEGDLDRASDLLGESRATLMSLGDRVSLGAVLQAMGTVAQSQGDIAGAARAYTDGLIAVAEVGDRVTAALCLEGLAALAVAGEVPGRAALLFASAEVLREEIGCPVPPTQLAAHHHAIASARALLDEHSWSDAWANGRLMTLERAVEYALSGSQGAN